MKLLLLPVVAGLLVVVRADTKNFGSSELYVVSDSSRGQSDPSSYSSSSTGFSERSDNSQKLNSHVGSQSFQPSSYSSLLESNAASLGFGTPRPYTNFRRNDLQNSGFGAGFGAPGLLQAGASPAGSISNFLGSNAYGAQGLGSDFGLQQGGLGGLFGSQQQAFNPYQMQQFQSQLGGLGGGQGFSPLQQPLQLGSGAEAFSRYALPGQGFQGSAFGDLGQQGLLSGGQYLGAGSAQNFPTTAQLPFGVQAALRQAQTMQQPFFAPRGTQGFGNSFSQLQPHFGGALGGFGNGGGGFGGGGRGSSSSSGGRGSSRGSGSSVTSRLFAPLSQLASSFYGSSDDDTRRADKSQRTRGGFLGRGSMG